MGKFEINETLNKYSKAALSNFFILLVLGLVLGNLVFLYVSTAPLIFFLMGLIINIPHEIKGGRKLSKNSIKRGEEIELFSKIEISAGIGPVIIRDELPDSFELVRGNNIHLVWKGLGKKTFSFSYKVRCPKRGTYVISKTNYFAKHVLRMRPAESGSLSDESNITVNPSSSEIDEVERQHIGKLPMPKGDVSKIGIRTTDFKEIRQYNYGDPLRFINWKATAKRGKSARPLVNEYEVEGKKTIWLFLDADFDFRVGNTVENLFEECIEAANGFTKFFTDKRYLVGMYVFNSNKQLFYPGTGEKQYNRVRKALRKLECSDQMWKEGLDGAVDECRKFLQIYQPLPVIITNLSKETKSLREGCKKLRALLSPYGRKKIPFLLLNVLPYSLNPTPNTLYKRNTAVFDMIEQNQVKSFLRKNGATIIDWDPKEEKFMKAFLRRVEASEN